MKEINKIEKFLISGSESLENILTLMEKKKEKFFIVVDAKKKLLGTISDADIRRELISSGLNASSNAQKIMNSTPIFSTDKEKDKWSNYFIENEIEHLPICTEDKIVEKGIKSNLKIVDLTGAGDLFAGGYLHGFINNLNPDECLEKGTEMSSKVIQQIGARL